MQSRNFLPGILFLGLAAFLLTAWVARPVAAIASDEPIDPTLSEQLQIAAVFTGSALVRVRDEDCNRLLLLHAEILGYRLDAIEAGGVVMERPGLRVRLRVDGALHDTLLPPPSEDQTDEVESCREMLREEPDNEELARQLAEVLLDTDPYQSYAMTETWLRAHAETTSWQTTRAVCLLRLRAYHDCVEYLSRAIREPGADVDDYALSIHWYNLACAYSLWNKPAEALQALKSCAALNDITMNMIRTDPDFNASRDNPDFKAYVESLPEE